MTDVSSSIPFQSRHYKTVVCRAVRGETRSRMPFSNRMALGVLAARLVDGGGKPTKVWPPLVFAPVRFEVFVDLLNQLVRLLCCPACARPPAAGSGAVHVITGPHS